MKKQRKKKRVVANSTKGQQRLIKRNVGIAYLSFIFSHIQSEIDKMCHEKSTFLETRSALSFYFPSFSTLLSSQLITILVYLSIYLYTI